VSASPGIGAAIVRQKDGGQRELVVTVEQDVPTGPISGEVLLSISGENPLTLKVPVLGQVVGNARAQPPDLFFGVVAQGASVTRKVSLLASRGTVSTCSWSVSEPLKDRVTVTADAHAEETTLSVTLRLPGVLPGTKTSTKVEGDILVTVSILPGGPSSTSASSEVQTPSGDPQKAGVAASGVLRIPIIAFVAGEDRDTIRDTE